jgi:hypothetical protein
MMMEVTSFSEILAQSEQTTRRHVPECNRIHDHRRDNRKSCKGKYVHRLKICLIFLSDAGLASLQKLRNPKSVC